MTATLEITHSFAAAKAAGREPEHEGMPPEEPVDIAMLRRVGEEFGLEIVGPPLQPTRR